MAAPTLIRDGTDQELEFELRTPETEDGYLRGEVDEEPLLNAKIKIRLAKGSWVTIDDPTILWDETGQFWRGTIPYSYGGSVLLSRNCQVTIQIYSPTNDFELQNILAFITSINGGGSTSIIKHGDYRIDKDAQTITLTDTTITISQITGIYDLTQQADLYIPRNARNYIPVSDPDRSTKLDITMDTPGVISYAADLTSITNDDILIIEYSP